jgi:hypothetical protein
MMHVFEMIVTIGMVIGGCVVALVPARLLLKMDRSSGYWIYTQEMKATGDEKRAIAKAATFYRALGGCLIVIALVMYLVVLFLPPATR